MKRLGVKAYKRSPRKALTALLNHMERVGVRLGVAPEVRARCESYTSGPGGTDYDAADALVATGIAALFCEGLAREVVGEPAALRAVEGAIWSL